MARGSFSHTLQFSGLMLMCKGAKQLCDMSVALVRAIEEDQAMAISRSKTRRGCQCFYEDAAVGHHIAVLCRTVDDCQRYVAKLSAEFKANGPVVGDELVHRKVTKAAFHLCLALVWQFGSARMMYWKAPPFSMMGLLSADGEVRRRAVLECEELADSLAALETNPGPNYIHNHRSRIFGALCKGAIAVCRIRNLRSAVRTAARSRKCVVPVRPIFRRYLLCTASSRTR